MKKIKRKSVFYSVVVNLKTMIAFLAVILFLIYDHYTSFPYIHDYVYNEQDDWYITIEDKIAVPPTILDYKIELPYMYGIRLDANSYNCDSHVSHMIGKQRKYFIFNLRNGDYFSFNSYFTFENALSEVSILLNESSMHYSMFKHIWNKYNDRYKRYDLYSRCDMDNPLISYKEQSWEGIKNKELKIIKE